MGGTGSSELRARRYRPVDVFTGDRGDPAVRTGRGLASAGRWTRLDRLMPVFLIVA